jgi:hypothetical protein
MVPDSRWVDIFKDPDYQLCITIACGLFLVLNHWANFHLPEWVVPLALFAFLLFGCLTVISVLSAWLRARP